MSVRNNAIAATAANALGITIGALGPVVESLLNDVEVSAIKSAGVDRNGRAVVFVDVKVGAGATQTRPVADSAGNVRIFTNAAAIISSMRRAAPAVQVDYTPFVAAATVGDPIRALIARHRAAKTEAQRAYDALSKPQTGLTALIAAADALGWDTAQVGSPERIEWDDLQARSASVTEWKTKADAMVTDYTASLVAAGIDPVTYLPTNP